VRGMPGSIYPILRPPSNSLRNKILDNVRRFLPRNRAAGDSMTKSTLAQILGARNKHLFQALTDKGFEVEFHSHAAAILGVDFPDAGGDGAPGMESPCGRTRFAQPFDERRPCGACGLLRRLRALGPGNGGYPEVRNDDQISIRISSSIAIRLSR